MNVISSIFQSQTLLGHFLQINLVQNIIDIQKEAITFKRILTITRTSVDYAFLLLKLYYSQLPPKHHSANKFCVLHSSVIEAKNKLYQILKKICMDCI